MGNKTIVELVVPLKRQNSVHTQELKHKNQPSVSNQDHKQLKTNHIKLNIVCTSPSRGGGG